MKKQDVVTIRKRVMQRKMRVIIELTPKAKEMLQARRTFGLPKVG
jgi:hypothetical protein